MVEFNNNIHWHNTEIDIKAEKHRILNEKDAVEKKIDKINDEFRAELEKGAESDEPARTRHAHQAKLQKQKREIKEQHLEKLNTALAFCLIISHARELSNLSNKDTTDFDEIMNDPTVDPAPVQQSLRDSTGKYELDKSTVAKVQNKLDVQILDIEQNQPVDIEPTPDDIVSYSGPEEAEDIDPDLDIGDIDIDSELL